jgi:aspartyl-tRNA(Asn)/glutamyl-tRNA(Gln) amidotransferase subunit A
MDAGTLAQHFARRTLSPVEALQSVLARLDAINPKLNAVIARDDDGALAAARESAARWSRGAPLSALDGVAVSVKDNIPVRGLPCQWGSRLHAGDLPARDESPVRRLREAGAVLFGKTNVPEFTLQGYTDNALHGVTRNPWDTWLTPGGSSGGAVAAVAAGIGPLAIATDGGGSIRRPCAYTGLVGLKPSWGAVPRADGLPEMLPGLEVIGPIARHVGDVARILQVLAPSMQFFEFPEPVASRSLRIAYWRSIDGSPVDPLIDERVAAVADQFRDMGHYVAETEAPDVVSAFNRLAWPVLGASGLAAILQHRSPDDHALLTPAMAELLRFGRELGAVALFDAQALQRSLREVMDRLFISFDAVLTPACAAMPWPARDSHPPKIDGRPVDARGHAVFTAFVNGAGLPALALPAEPSAEGMPIGFQLVGAHGSDAALCALGAEFERLHSPRLRWPEPA